MNRNRTLMAYESTVRITFAKSSWIQHNRKSTYLNLNSLSQPSLIGRSSPNRIITHPKPLNFSYTLVVSQYEKTATIYYTLRAYCRDPFELKKLGDNYVGKETVTGEWAGPSAGGCQNHMMTYKNNPKYCVKLGPKDNAELVIELRGPKIYQVGLEVVVVSLDDPSMTAPFVSKLSGSYRSGYCVIALENLPAGQYNVIPSAFLPSQEGPFILNFKATTGITVGRAN